MKWAKRSNFYFNFETDYYFVSYDIDEDSFLEYAHNLNNNLFDGYEVYADSGGTETSVYHSSDLNSDNQVEFYIQIQFERIDYIP